MSIQSQWKQKYNLLKEYTAANPEIYIDPNEVSIPKHLRDAFYQHFDDVRDTIAEECYNSLPGDVNALCRNYIRSEKEVVNILKLERIDLPVDLLSFLRDPKQGLVRGLYNRLFELVQGKISEDDFERMADSDITATAWDLYRLGYEPWAALALIELLEPDEVFGVQLDEDFEPFVTGLNEIAFGRQFHHVAKRIPEFIVHSKKLDRYIAVKMPLAREVDTYYIPFEPPVKPKKRTGDTSYVLDSRVMFLSCIPDLKKIPVYADIHSRKIQSPDLTIEFMTAQDMADPEALGQAQRRVEIMKPKLGGCFVVMNPEPESDIAKPSEDVEVLAAGLDLSGLQPIVNKLA